LLDCLLIDYIFELIFDECSIFIFRFGIFKVDVDDEFFDFVELEVLFYNFFLGSISFSPSNASTFTHFPDLFFFLSLFYTLFFVLLSFLIIFYYY
jgi:hypothetical protein